VYTGTFTVPTSPLTATQSSGTNISAIASSANTICIVIQDALTDSQGYYTLTVTSNFYLAFNVPASPFSLVTVPVTTLALQSTLARDNSLMNIPFTGAASGTTNRSFSPFGNGVSLLTAQSSITADNGPDGYTITNNSAYYETAITPFGLQTPVTLLMAQTSNVLYDASGSGVSIGNAGTAIPVNIVNGPFNNDPTLLALQGSVINDSSNNLITSTMYSTGNTVITTDNGPFTASKSITSFLTNTGGYNDVSFANAYIAIGNTANASTAPTANIMMNPFTITSSLVSVLAMQSNTVTTESSLNNLTITTLNTAPTISATSPFGTYYANGLILLNSNINSNTNTVANTIANILVTAGDAVTTNNYSVTIATTAPNLYSNTVNNDYKGANYVLASSYVTGGIFDSANVYILAESLANANSLSNSSSFIITTFVSNDALASINNGLSNVSQANANFFISDIANSNLAETLSNANIPSANYTRSTIDSGFTGSLAPSPVGGIVYLPTYSYTDGVVITAANVQNSSGSGSFATNTQIWYQG
jgi:hypothetical protein